MRITFVRRHEKGPSMTSTSPPTLQSHTHAHRNSDTSRQHVDVVVIGGGQAGLAVSYGLTAQGRPPVVLEQGRVAESWRSRPWDSLHVVGPNWTLQFPGFPYR